jgi:hypothetical protein
MRQFCLHCHLQAFEAGCDVCLSWSVEELTRDFHFSFSSVICIDLLPSSMGRLFTDFRTNLHRQLPSAADPDICVWELTPWSWAFFRSCQLHSYSGVSQHNPVHTTACYLRSSLIFSSNLRQGLPSGPFFLGFPTALCDIS